MFEALKRSLLECPVVDRDGYQYFVHPITDGVPFIKPEILDEITRGILQIVGDKEYDYIGGAEAMALPIGTALSLKTRKPFMIFRKRPYGLPGEVTVDQRTGYSHNYLYLNGLSPGDKIIIVDDVISTGGTIRALTKVLKEIGVVIEDIIIVFEKGGNRDEIEKIIGLPLHTLIRVDVVDGQVIIED